MMYLKDKDVRVSLRISELDYEWLKKMANYNNSSISWVIRKLIFAYRCYDTETENEYNKTI